MPRKRRAVRNKKVANTQHHDQRSTESQQQVTWDCSMGTLQLQLYVSSDEDDVDDFDIFEQMPENIPLGTSMDAVHPAVRRVMQSAQKKFGLVAFMDVVTGRAKSKLSAVPTPEGPENAARHFEAGTILIVIISRNMMQRGDVVFRSFVEAVKRAVGTRAWKAFLAVERAFLYQYKEFRKEKDMIPLDAESLPYDYPVLLEKHVEEFSIAAKAAFTGWTPKHWPFLGDLVEAEGDTNIVPFHGRIKITYEYEMTCSVCYEYCREPPVACTTCRYIICPPCRNKLANCGYCGASYPPTIDRC
eukprot:2165760-Pleurochrysis_carterae.AAC.1